VAPDVSTKLANWRAKGDVEDIPCEHGIQGSARPKRSSSYHLHDIELTEKKKEKKKDSHGQISRHISA
jgi:hypothetical protein